MSSLFREDKKLLAAGAVCFCKAHSRVRNATFVSRDGLEISSLICF